MGVETGSSQIRIAIFEPAAGSAGASAALERLGREARLEIFHDVQACIERGRSGEVDLVVLDLSSAGPEDPG